MNKTEDTASDRHEIEHGPLAVLAATDADYERYGVARDRLEPFEDEVAGRALRFALVERLEAVAQRHGVAPGAVAVASTPRNPAVDGAIVVFRRPDQVDPIVDAANLELGDDDVVMIEGRA
jgi:aryl-alcohol dehydrogenase-like predicted oxidoreductase